MGLREDMESALAETLEGDWALPVVLVAPDGSESSYSGQVIYETVQFEEDTSTDIIVKKPVVSLRISSLNRIPLQTEKWFCKIPMTPDATAQKVTHRIENVSQGGYSIGFIRLYLQQAAEITRGSFDSGFDSGFVVAA
jgi:hypothetical protein